MTEPNGKFWELSLIFLFIIGAGALWTCGLLQLLKLAYQGLSLLLQGQLWFPR